MNYDKPFIASVAQTPPPIQWYSQYNSQCGRILFNEIHADVYNKVDSTPPPKKAGIPLVLKIVGGITAGATLIFCHKGIWKGVKKIRQKSCKIIIPLQQLLLIEYR